ncbi:MAG: DUF3618 domain-containing protein [Rhodospirillales bacterium]
MEAAGDRPVSPPDRQVGSYRRADGEGEDRMNTRSADEIELKLDADRAAVDATLAEIQARLSPNQVLDQAAAYVRDNGSDIAASLRDSFRENPWPAVVTCVGLTWLVAATSGGRRRHEGTTRADRGNHHADAVARARAAAAGTERRAEETESAFEARLTEAKAKALTLRQEAAETAEDFAKRVESTMQQAQDAAAQWVERAGDAWEHGRAMAADHAGQIRDGARAVRNGAQQAQGRIKEAYEAQPLAVGALGMAIGTLLGALLPTTRREDELLGATGEHVRKMAGDLASSAVERGRQAASETLAEAEDAMASELTPARGPAGRESGRRDEQRAGAGNGAGDGAAHGRGPVGG